MTVVRLLVALAVVATACGFGFGLCCWYRRDRAREVVAAALADARAAAAPPVPPLPRCASPDGPLMPAPPPAEPVLPEGAGTYTPVWLARTAPGVLGHRLNAAGDRTRCGAVVVNHGQRRFGVVVPAGHAWLHHRTRWCTTCWMADATHTLPRRKGPVT